MLWQCLSEFSCFGNKHCAFESCWDTLAFFTDLLLTPHTRSRLVFIVYLRKENIQISIQCCPSVCHFSLHSIALFGKKEKQSAEIDNDIYTCRIAKVNINTQRECHLRMIKGDMLQEERHVAELQCKRQAEKGIQWCMQEEKKHYFQVCSPSIGILHLWMPVPGATWIAVGTWKSGFVWCGVQWGEQLCVSFTLHA